MARLIKQFARITGPIVWACLILILASYGVLRLHVLYERGRAEQLLIELSRIQLGAPESSLSSVIHRFRCEPCRTIRRDQNEYYLLQAAPLWRQSDGYTMGYPSSWMSGGRFSRYIPSAVQYGMGLRNWQVNGVVEIADRKVKSVAAETIVELGVPQYHVVVQTFVVPELAEFQKSRTRLRSAADRTDLQTYYLAVSDYNAYMDMTPGAPVAVKRSAFDINLRCLSELHNCTSLSELTPLVKMH